MTEHGRQSPRPPQPSPRVANRLLLRRGDRLVAVGEAVRRALIDNEGFPAGRVEVVYNGVDLSAFADADRDRERRSGGSWASGPGTSCWSRWPASTPSRTTSRRLRALERGVRNARDVRLVIVGDGEKRARSPRSSGSVAWSRIVRGLGLRNDIPRLTGAADLALLTSISEGIPLTLIEAMGAGLPVVATRVGGVPEVVQEGRTGLLSPAGDDAGLAEQILRLAADPALRERLGRAGREVAHAAFTEDRMVGEYDRIYRELAAASGRSRPARVGVRVGRGDFPDVWAGRALGSDATGACRRGSRRPSSGWPTRSGTAGRTTGGAWATPRRASPWGSAAWRSSTSPRTATSRWTRPAGGTSWSSTARSTTSASCAASWSGRVHRFRGHSDTEVMLAAHRALGASTPPCGGSTACSPSPCGTGRSGACTWPATGSARSRCTTAGRATTFLFGSELKALRAHPAFRAEVDRDALALYLRHSYVPAPCSIYEGIRKLPPATLLTRRRRQPRGDAGARARTGRPAAAAEAGRADAVRGDRRGGRRPARGAAARRGRACQHGRRRPARAPSCPAASTPRPSWR